MVLSPDEVQSAATGYFLQEGMLLLKWMSQSEFAGGELVVQIVVPTVEENSFCVDSHMFT